MASLSKRKKAWKVSLWSSPVEVAQVALRINVVMLLAL
jgi:hypothetical protein